jgi:rare lipoprotein A
MHTRQTRIRSLKVAAVIATAWGLAAAASVVSLRVAAQSTADPNAPVATSGVDARVGGARPVVHIDRSGRKQVGTASFYASRYSGKTMADGTPMRLYSNNAASLTLPLGTTAKVTNLETGRSAVVTICDRGPYVNGRVIDLSPATARLIGISRKQGLARVEVAPIAIPLADGSIRVASLN